MLRSFLGRPKTVRVPINNTYVEIQQVEVTNRAKPLIGRFLTTVLVTYCVANTLSWIASDGFKNTSQDVRSRLEELRKEQEKVRKTKQHSEHWKKQHADLASTPAAQGKLKAGADESQIIHITIPVWFRKKKQRMHTVQDREWQDAKDLISDKKRLEGVKRQTADAVFRLCKHRPDLLHWLAFIQFDGRVGMEFDVAPQMATQITYEVPCVFIKPDQVGFGWRPLSAASGARIERTFHPVIFARAFYAGLKTFTTTSLTITASRLKATLSNPSELRVEVTAKNSSLSSSKSLQEKPSLLPQPTPQQSPKKPALDASEPSSFLRPTSHLFSWKAHQARAQSMTYKEALDNARKAFRSEWMTKQLTAIQSQTPGLCMIVGHVTMMGKKGQFRLGVTAFYSPSEKAFVGIPRITGRLLIPDLVVLDAIEKEKQRSAATQPARNQQVSNSTPEKQPVQAASPVRPASESKK